MTIFANNATTRYEDKGAFLHIQILKMKKCEFLDSDYEAEFDYITLNTFIFRTISYLKHS